MDGPTAKRLALIRHLFNVGVEQSRHAEPINAISLLSFHDAVELFLQLTTERYGISKNDRTFMAYWDAICPKIGEPLHQRESMKRLNRARSQLKHHGVLPASTDVESFRVSTRNFFVKNTPLVFGKRFDTISLVDFVNSPDVRAKLSSAEELIKKECLKDALNEIKRAFDSVVHEYISGKLYYDSPLFRFESDFEFSDRDSIKDESVGEFVDEVGEAIPPMQEAITILSLGLDYRKYAKFRAILSRKISQRENREIDHVEFCFDYVIESAIHLQNFDYGIDRGANRSLHEYLDAAESEAGNMRSAGLE